MENKQEKANMGIGIIGGGLLLLILLGGIFFLVRKQKNKLGEKKALQKKTIISPLPTVSQDDKVDTLKKEINETTINDSSSDLQDIKKDINGL